MKAATTEAAKSLVICSRETCTALSACMIDNASFSYADQTKPEHMRSINLQQQIRSESIRESPLFGPSPGDHGLVHVIATGCSGKRQRTSFVPLSEFGEDHLISDYNLLEEAAQLAESAQRTRQRTSNAQSAQIAKVRHMQHQVRALVPSGFDSAFPKTKYSLNHYRGMPRQHHR